MGTTLQEQLDWLNEARKADADLGFRGRMLALCSLRWTGQGKTVEARNQIEPLAGKPQMCPAGWGQGSLLAGL